MGTNTHTNIHTWMKSILCAFILVWALKLSYLVSFFGHKYSLILSLTTWILSYLFSWAQILSYSLCRIKTLILYEHTNIVLFSLCLLAIKLSCTKISLCVWALALSYVSKQSHWCSIINNGIIDNNNLFIATLIKGEEYGERWTFICAKNIWWCSLASVLMGI